MPLCARAGSQDEAAKKLFPSSLFFFVQMSDFGINLILFDLNYDIASTFQKWTQYHKKA